MFVCFPGGQVGGWHGVAGCVSLPSALPFQPYIFTLPSVSISTLHKTKSDKGGDKESSSTLLFMLSLPPFSPSVPSIPYGKAARQECSAALRTLLILRGQPGSWCLLPLLPLLPLPQRGPQLFLPPPSPLLPSTPIPSSLLISTSFIKVKELL